MEVIKYAEPFNLNIDQSIASIGNYDGVHLGHQHVLRELTEKSKRNDCKSIVITFEPHPRIFFSKDAKPFLLTSFDEKVALIDKFPVDYLIYFEFDQNFASITAKDFIENIIIDKIKAKEVIVGYNFMFGKGREGNTDYLKKMGAQNDFTVNVVEAKKIGDDHISSTFIRSLISAGEMQKAARFLTRNYFLTGEVIRGKNIGKEIGFPTINISVTDKLLPKDGVYSVWVTLDGEKHKGVANIGYQPTFGENAHSIEAHIMDFDEDIYGSRVTLEFVLKLRDEMKFQGANELSAQIKKDVESAQASLKGV